MRHRKRLTGMFLAILMLLTGSFGFAAFAENSMAAETGTVDAGKAVSTFKTGTVVEGEEPALIYQTLEAVSADLTEQETEDADSLINWAESAWGQLTGQRLETGGRSEETGIRISGMLPEGAAAESSVISLTRSSRQKESGLFAYSIAVYDGEGRVYSPAEEGLTVTIMSSRIRDAVRNGSSVRIYTDMLCTQAQHYDTDVSVSEEGVTFTVPQLPCKLLITEYNSQELSAEEEDTLVVLPDEDTPMAAPGFNRKYSETKEVMPAEPLPQKTIYFQVSSETEPALNAVAESTAPGESAGEEDASGSEEAESRSEEAETTWMEELMLWPEVTEAETTGIEEPILWSEEIETTGIEEPILWPEEIETTGIEEPILWSEEIETTGIEEPILWPEEIETTGTEEPILWPEETETTGIEEPIFWPEEIETTGTEEPVLWPEETETTGPKEPEFQPENIETETTGTKEPELQPKDTAIEITGTKEPEFQPEDTAIETTGTKEPELQPEDSETETTGTKETGFPAEDTESETKKQESGPEIITTEAETIEAETAESETGTAETEEETETEEAETEPETDAEDTEDETSETPQINQLIFTDENVYLTGMMPVTAVVDVTPVDVEIEGQIVLAAYDIAIYENEEQQAEGIIWQPEADTVQVHILDPELEKIDNEEISVYGMEDTDAEAELSDSAQVDAARVIVDAGESPIVVVARMILEKSIVVNGNAYHITVSYDTTAQIPDGAELVVSEVDGEPYLEETAKTLDWTEEDEIYYTRFLDISIQYNGQIIEPAAPVEVLIELLDVEEGAEALQVIHFAEDGPEEVASSSTEDAVVSFEADSFSVYGFGSVLRPVAKEENELAEVTVLAFDIADAPHLAGAETENLEEGLELVGAYHLEAAEGSSAYNRDDTDRTTKLWLRAELSEEAHLSERESVVLCSIADDQISDVILEELSDEKQLMELESGTEGFALIKDSGYRRYQFELNPESSGERGTAGSEGENAAAILLDGMMPKNASAEASDVTTEYAAVTFAETAETDSRIFFETADVDASAFAETTAAEGSEEEKTTLAAYDITILENGAEYQPDEAHPVSVTILNPAITDNERIELWHIRDDGSKEQIEDFERADGQIRFEAVAFSVYAIVEGPEPVEAPDAKTAKTLDELAGNGFYLSISKSGKGTCYFKNTLNTKNCIARTGDGDQASAAIWYLEPAGQENQYYLYTLVGNRPVYMKANGTTNMELTQDKGTVFEVSLFKEGVEGVFYFNVPGTTNGLNFSGSGDGFKCYNIKNDDCKVVLTYPVSLGKDPYGMDGKTYGLMNYSGGTTGNALIAQTGSTGRLKALMLPARTNPLDREDYLYVAKNSDISLWTFHAEEEGGYTLSAQASSGTVYLKASEQGLFLAQAEDATVFELIPGTGSNAGKIRLAANGRAVNFTGSTGNGFNTDKDAVNNWKLWLNLVDLSDLSEEDFVIYTANKVSVSDETVTNGSRIIIYTRAWNETEKKYEFYAIDHNGELVPCYESGDTVQWVGTRVNTMLWNLTEYYYEGTNTPNNYYDLKNPYSGKYLAPQIRDGQILSASPLGINLNGRRYQDYYSTILAWDDPYYAYAGLKVSEGRIVSCPMAQAEDFYFAVMQDPQTYDPLTQVATVDHTQYGITMKLVNFESDKLQNQVLGNSDGGAVTWTVPNLLSTRLSDDGYPVATLTGTSLSTLYAGGQEVNHLFIGSTYSGSGYYEFDSTQNFASLHGSDFAVYQELGTMDNSSKPTLKHGQFMPYNDLTPGVMASINDENLYSATAKELSEDNPRKHEKMYLVRQPDYYFGVEIEASFVQTPNGLDAWGHDIIYEFTGDDDFWLYVDGELIIDLGGIHSALPGKVNYCTGEVEVNGTRTTLRALFESNYISRNPGASAEEVEEFLSGYFEDGSTVFRDYTTHTMKIFYMERGAGASNLHMRFNLSSVKQDQVLLNKKISGTEKEDYKLAEYGYQIYYRFRTDPEGEFRLLKEKENGRYNVTYQNKNVPVKYLETYTPAGAQTEYEHVFFLNPGETAAITMPGEIAEYYIVECGVNMQVYDAVAINDQETEGTPTQDEIRLDYQTSVSSVAERQRVVFDNHVSSNAMRTLTITKKLFEVDGETLVTGDPTGFSFRLYLGGENDTELSAAYLQDYCVKDPEGNYCRWDMASQSFVSLGKTGYEDLTEDERISATFQTSMNGAISKIPADYKVEVRDLLVGTRFRVEELAAEIPAGYAFLAYMRDSDSYIVEEGDTENSGIIRDSQSPAIEVHNKRGFGLTAQKVWSDAGFVSSHGDIYIAVYVKGTLLPGTVRQLKYPATSVYYYFDELVEGTGLAEYQICEVRLTGNPVIAEDGTVTGDFAAVRVENGESITVEARAKGASEDNPFVYTVSYAAGRITGAAENVRTDTITNTRSGIRLIKQDMSGQPLAGAAFTLTDESGVFAGEEAYISSADGLITIAYLKAGETYTLTETGTPHGFLGSEAPILIRLESDGTVYVSGGDVGSGGTVFFSDGTVVGGDGTALGSDGSVPGGDGTALGSDGSVVGDGGTNLGGEETAPGGDGSVVGDGGTNLGGEETAPGGDGSEQYSGATDRYTVVQASGTDMASVIIRNRPVTFAAVKVDGKTGDKLSGAHFALYRQVRFEDGTYGPDYVPMEGYRDLVTGDDGVIPGIDLTLEAGTYYLHETESPDGYRILSGDIAFTISSTHAVTLGTAPAGVQLEETAEADGALSYQLVVSNASTADLTVIKTVTGDLGDRTKEFTFTLTFSGSDAAYSPARSGNAGNTNATAFGEDAVYTYTKYSSDNGTDFTPMTGEDASGTLTAENNTFRLAHNQKIVIEGLPQDAELQVTEQDAGYYTTTFTLNGRELTPADGVQDNGGGATDNGGRAADNGGRTSVSGSGRTAGFALSDDAVLQVTNNLNAVSPTGISTVTKPFLLMCLAGLALLGILAAPALLRRRRKSDE